MPKALRCTLLSLRDLLVSAGPFVLAAEYPIAREAERAITGGRPFLQRYLPFWLANLVERMWLALVRA